MLSQMTPGLDHKIPNGCILKSLSVAHSSFQIKQLLTNSPEKLEHVLDTMNYNNPFMKRNRTDTYFQMQIFMPISNITFISSNILKQLINTTELFLKKSLFLFQSSHQVNHQNGLSLDSQQNPNIKYSAWQSN